MDTIHEIKNKIHNHTTLSLKKDYVCCVSQGIILENLVICGWCAKEIKPGKPVFVSTRAHGKDNAYIKLLGYTGKKGLNGHYPFAGTCSPAHAKQYWNNKS